MDVMGTITNELKPRILAEYEAIQSQIAEFRKSFAKCEEEREVGFNKSYHVHVGIPPLVSKHKACRFQESDLARGLLSCEATLKTSKEVEESTCQAIRIEKIPDVESCASHNEDAETFHRRLIKEFQERLESIRSKKSLCANATEALKLQEAVCAGQGEELKEHRSSCNSMQMELDGSACELSRSMTSTCEQYRECRSQEVLSYDVVQNTVKEREGALQEEWKALGRIECILDAFLQADIVSATQACLRASYSSSYRL